MNRLSKMNIGQTYDLLNRTSKIYLSKKNEEKSIYETLELLIWFIQTNLMLNGMSVNRENTQ